MKRLNIITGAIFLVISVASFIYSSGFVAKLPTDPLGPAWWPKGLSLLLILLAIGLILQGILTPAEKDKPSPFNFKSEGFHRVLKLCGVLIIFLLITYFVGIYVGLLFMVPTTMYLLGERKKLLLVIFPIATDVFIFVVFKLLLRVPLPSGLLFR